MMVGAPVAVFVVASTTFFPVSADIALSVFRNCTLAGLKDIKAACTALFIMGKHLVSIISCFMQFAKDSRYQRSLKNV